MNITIGRAISTIADISPFRAERLDLTSDLVSVPNRLAHMVEHLCQVPADFPVDFNGPGDRTEVLVLCPMRDVKEGFAEVPADPGLVDDAIQFVCHRRVIFLACRIDRTQQAVPGPQAAGKHLQRIGYLIVELGLPSGDQQVQKQGESDRCGKYE